MSFKIWTFGFEQKIENSQAALMSEMLQAYLDTWNTHGALLVSSFQFVRNQFLIVSVPDDSEQPSGCSLDAMHGEVTKISSTLGLKLFDENNIIYYSGDAFVSANRPDFRRLVREENLPPETLVADFSIRSVDSSMRRDSHNDFEGVDFESVVIKAAHVSWHGKVFWG